MNTMEALLTRRSIREYRAEPIPPEVVRRILEAAMHAPSGNNEQPWHFVVIDDPQLLGAIPAIHSAADMAAGAPLGILVCGDPRLEKVRDMWPLDCAAATQNLMLAAWEHGVGSVWTGISHRPQRVEAFRQLFGVPDEIVPFALVVLGYPAAAPKEAHRFREDRVHANRW
ncbi:MAG: nitroreductase family protein [Chloroflexi bacterium]|nr:nitroreductase family protein [Chloroflexota bacterium]